MTDTQKRLKEFDKNFVKDCGPDIEPIFIDAIGSVGPIRQFLATSINQAVAEERDRVVGMIGEDEMAISQSSMNSGRMSKQEAFIVEIRNKFRTELKAKIKDSQPTY